METDDKKTYFRQMSNAQFQIQTLLTLDKDKLFM